MISNSSKYALKAVLYLAVNSSKDKKILAKDLSVAANVPQAYLSKILQALSRRQIVSSVRGPKGGFYLSKKNRAVPLMAIIQVIDGSDRLSSCMMNLLACNAQHPCPIHDMVGAARLGFVKKLEETNVQDLVADIEAGKSFLPL